MTPTAFRSESAAQYSPSRTLERDQRQLGGPSLEALVQAAAQILAGGRRADDLASVEHLWRSGATSAPEGATAKVRELLALFLRADEDGVDPTDMLAPLEELLSLKGVAAGAESTTAA
jgi:hypothetical protein